MSGAVELRVLGSLEGFRDGQPLSLGGTKQRTVLGALLLAPNQVVSTGKLIQAVWGEDAPSSTTRTLQVYLSKLRQELNPDRSPERELIVTTPPGYTALARPEMLDLLRFKEGVIHARAAIENGEPQTAVNSYRNALALWHGTPLADLVGTSDLIDRESERLDLSRLVALAECLDAELSLGRHSELLPELHSLVDGHPLDERFRAQLMIALYRAGRQAAALRTFAVLRQTLGEELGLEPGADLRQLEEQILTQDPALMEWNTSAPDLTATIRQDRDQRGEAWLETSTNRFDLNRAVTTIGRAPDRNVVLDDPSVSRKHAEVRRMGDRLRVVDVGSMNGIEVNGERVAETDLADGDSLAIGDAKLRFRSKPSDSR